jgi:T5orf172 domain
MDRADDVPDAASVYLIGEVGQRNRFKIGVAVDVEDRLSALQGGNYRPLACFYQIALETRELAFAAEQECHRRLERRHIRGEWFAVPMARARITIQSAVRYAIEVDPKLRWASLNEGGAS